MTWTISANGTKEQASSSIERSSFNGTDENEKKHFEAAKDLALAFVDSIGDEAHASVSVTGSKSAVATYSVSVSMSTWVPERNAGAKG